MPCFPSPCSYLKWLILPLLILTFSACSSVSDLSLEGQIREYLYKYQPTTGDQFIKWANQNLLPRYSPRQIYAALHKEAKFQAELEHPNVVGVLSFAARAWAKENDFQYDDKQWLALQQEAITHLKNTPEKLQLWPDTAGQ
ncbi:MAG: hypothetical protein KJ077_03415 [Anaerolineae bacterium]|nr:hypothetical protein [Anaerolineae bacterium]